MDEGSQTPQASGVQTDCRVWFQPVPMEEGKKKRKLGCSYLLEDLRLSTAKRFFSQSINRFRTGDWQEQEGQAVLQNELQVGTKRLKAAPSQ